MNNNNYYYYYSDLRAGYVPAIVPTTGSPSRSPSHGHYDNEQLTAGAFVNELITGKRASWNNSTNNNYNKLFESHSCL